MADEPTYLVSGVNAVAGVKPGGTVTHSQLVAAGAPIDAWLRYGHLARRADAGEESSAEDPSAPEPVALDGDTDNPPTPDEGKESDS